MQDQISIEENLFVSSDSNNEKYSTSLHNPILNNNDLAIHFETLRQSQIVVLLNPVGSVPKLKEIKIQLFSHSRVVVLRELIRAQLNIPQVFLYIDSCVELENSIVLGDLHKILVLRRKTPFPELRIGYSAERCYE